MKMKKTIVMMAMALAMSMSGMAQEQTRNNRLDKAQMAQRQTEWMVKQYQLNEEQSKQLLELNTKYAATNAFGMKGRRPMGQRGQMGQGDNRRPERQMDPSMEAKRKERMQQREQQMKEYEAELQKIMTEEQFAAYQKNKQQRPDMPKVKMKRDSLKTQP